MRQETGRLVRDSDALEKVLVLPVIIMHLVQVLYSFLSCLL
jgi:hypothetical protein